jgi:D-lactate dehydrogenase (cytochrome)
LISLTVSVPFGAGSSVEGNFASPYGGIVIDLTFMNKIVAFHPDDMDVVVQPGVNWMDLNAKIEHEELFLPLDPSPTATVGGMVSTNCSGTNAFRYGTMKDWVVSLTVVLASGEVIKTRRRPRKTSAGYNLTSLFIGAEGTLGIVTEITLKLAVVPKETGVAVVSFASIADAASAASNLIRSGISLAAIELMDDVQMRVINRHGSADVRRTKWEESPSLFLKFSGPTKEGVQGDISRVKDIIQSANPSCFFFAKTRHEQMSLWAARKEALWTMTSIKPEGHAIWSTDVAVPISRLAEIIEISKREGAELGIFASIIGHVGDGNFHEALMYDANDPTLHAAVGKVIHKMMDRALEMEGTVSGEHAIGMGKMVRTLGLL